MIKKININIVTKNDLKKHALFIPPPPSEIVGISTPLIFPKIVTVVKGIKFAVAKANPVAVKNNLAISSVPAICTQYNPSPCHPDSS